MSDMRKLMETLDRISEMDDEFGDAIFIDIDDIVGQIETYPKEKQREVAWEAITEIADVFGIDVRA